MSAPLNGIGGRQARVQRAQEEQVAAQQAMEQQWEAIHTLVGTQIQPNLETLEEVMAYPIVAYFLDEGAVLADEQMEHLFEHLRRLGKQKQMGLWLHSRGGATETPWKVVSLFREHAEKLSVLIPYRAHSAATHVALGADEIIMTEMSELGPVDPSRRHPLLPKEEPVPGKPIPIPISVQDLRHVLEFVKREMGKELTSDSAARVYTALFDKVHPLAIGALEQSWALANQITERVLSTHMDPEKERDKIEAIGQRVSDYYKSHLYQINRKEAREIGLKAVDATDKQTHAMWQLYLAYRRLQISGEGELGGQPADVRRLGHMTSRVGSTVGLEIKVKTDPTQSMAQWHSQWTTTPPAP